MEKGHLTKMYDMQRSLYRHYQRLEGLPECPVDLNDRTNKALLRDFVFRIIEEMAEAFECLSRVYYHLSNNQAISAAVENRNFNDEIADAWHFILEVCLLVGIDESDLENLTRTVLVEAKGEEVSMEITENDLYLENMYTMGFDINLVNLYYQKLSSQKEFRLPINYWEEYPALWGGTKLSMDRVALISNIFWSCTSSLMIGVNFLKHKPWSQDKIAPNVGGFLDKWGEFMLLFMSAMVILDKKPLSIYESYKLKNIKNHERIKEGY